MNFSPSAAPRRTLPLPALSGLGLAALLLLLAAPHPARAAAPISIIPVTGQLLVGGSPATGNYDLTFQLYSAATGGSAFGPLVTVTNVAVSDGVFYAEVDFGNLNYGNPLYVQTSYRHAGTGTYTALSPRHVVPTAIYAANANYATLSGNTFRLQGTAVSATAPTANQVLTYTGGQWAPAAPASGGGTYTAGNGLTLSGSQFSVAVPLALSSSSSDVATLEASNSSGTGIEGVGSGGSTSYGVLGLGGGGIGVGGISAGDAVYGTNTNNNDYGFLGGTDPKYSAPAGVFGSDAGKGNGVLGISSGGTGSGMSGVSDGGFGMLGVSTSNDGVQGQTSESGHSGVSGVNNGSGHGVFGVSRSSGAYGFLGGTDPKYSAPTGVFGTNTTNSGNGVLGLGTSSTGVAGVSTSGDGVYASSGTGYGVYSVVSSASGQALFANNTASGSLVTLGDQDGDGVYAYAASGKSAIRCDGALNVNGHASVHVLQITGGSDVAEPYAVNAAEGVTAMPGLVVSIDPDHTGQMDVSHRAYDHAVAGILSGAGGVQAGLTLRQSGTVADGTLPVACSGRVWCYCDAEANGAIAPGDLLTTSDTPGHAMKAGSGHELRGAILGKAMSSLRSGRGLVLVLVTLE